MEEEVEEDEEDTASNDDDDNGEAAAGDDGVDDETMDSRWACKMANSAFSRSTYTEHTSNEIKVKKASQLEE